MNTRLTLFSSFVFTLAVTPVSAKMKPAVSAKAPDTGVDIAGIVAVECESSSPFDPRIAAEIEKRLTILPADQIEPTLVKAEAIREPLHRLPAQCALLRLLSKHNPERAFRRTVALLSSKPKADFERQGHADSLLEESLSVALKAWAASEPEAAVQVCVGMLREHQLQYAGEFGLPGESFSASVVATPFLAYLRQKEDAGLKLIRTLPHDLVSEVLTQWAATTDNRDEVILTELALLDKDQRRAPLCAMARRLGRAHRLNEVEKLMSGKDVDESTRTDMACGAASLDDLDWLRGKVSPDASGALIGTLIRNAGWHSGIPDLASKARRVCLPAETDAALAAICQFANSLNGSTQQAIPVCATMQPGKHRLQTLSTLFGSWAFFDAPAAAEVLKSADWLTKEEREALIREVTRRTR